MSHTWENLAEKVHFLLEVAMRELLVGRLHEVLPGVEEILKMRRRQSFEYRAVGTKAFFFFFNEAYTQTCVWARLTSMASKPQYSLASSSRGTSACSKRVVPHVFKMKRLLETNMLLSLRRETTTGPGVTHLTRDHISAPRC